MRAIASTGVLVIGGVVFSCGLPLTGGADLGLAGEGGLLVIVRHCGARSPNLLQMKQNSAFRQS